MDMLAENQVKPEFGLPGPAEMARLESEENRIQFRIEFAPIVLTQKALLQGAGASQV